MKRESKPRKSKNTPEKEAFLLIGLLYHGTQQHDALVMKNIFKDGLERAHKLYRMVKQ